MIKIFNRKLFVFITFLFLFLFTPLKTNAYNIYPQDADPCMDCARPPDPPDYVFYCDPDREACPGPAGYYSTLDPGQTYTTTRNLQTCTALGKPVNNVCCTDNGGCSFPDRSPAPQWTFDYAVSCTVTQSQNPFLTTPIGDLVYTYQSCNTEDRCYGSNTGASGSDPQGRIWPGRCSAPSYNGTDPNTACISGTDYKQCCTNPAPGFTPITACLNGVCPYGYKTADGDTTCDNPGSTPGPTATPVPTPGVCPYSGIWKGGPCNLTDAPKADSCSNPGAYPSTCNLCSLSACTLYQSPNLYCWQNTGQCYNDKTFCSAPAYTATCASCGAINSTRIICPTQTTTTCNR